MFTAPDPSQLNSAGQLSDHSKLDALVIVKTQLRWTKSRRIFCQSWSSKHVQNFTSNLLYSCIQFLEWSGHPTQLNCQLIDHSTQIAVVTQLASWVESGRHCEQGLRWLPFKCV